MTMKCVLRVLLLALALPAAAASALVLDDENRLTVTLTDGTAITLIGEAGASMGVRPATTTTLPRRPCCAWPSSPTARRSSCS